MTELEKLELKLAEIDRQIAASVDYIGLWHYKEAWAGIALKTFSPRLCAMKSDCLKNIAAAKVNQLLEQ